MATLGWQGGITSGTTATFNPTLPCAILDPGQTLVRSRIWISACGFSPDAYSYAAVAFPFALVMSQTTESPQWNPFTQWAVPESGVVLWSGMVPLYGNTVVPGITPPQYYSESHGDPEGWNTQAQRKNTTSSKYYVWLTGQLDVAVTVGEIFTAAAVRCLISTPA